MTVDNGTDNQPDRAPRPSRILAEPATVESCAGDRAGRRTPAERQVKAAAARDQFAFAASKAARS
jgi:hypothetical protein